MENRRKHKFIRVILACVLAAALLLAGCGGDGVKETEDITLGIDVARYQGTVDWEQVAASGIEFAMIRERWKTNQDTKSLGKEERKQRVHARKGRNLC